MKFSRGLLSVGLSALFLVGGGAAAVVSAPPASAGCLAIDSDNTYCDDPIAPDGTWQRCHQRLGNLVYQSRWVWKRMPSTSFCYRVDPSQPSSWGRVGEPQFHVDG